jgi:hypothetical protein
MGAPRVGAVPPQPTAVYVHIQHVDGLLALERPGAGGSRRAVFAVFVIFTSVREGLFIVRADRPIL